MGERMHGLAQWRERWRMADVATMPLVGKKAVCDAWQHVPGAEQWRMVGEAWRGNIGVRTGGGVAVIDCDEAATVGKVESTLAGLGLDLPKVSTATAGRAHFYLKVKDVPPGFNYAKLAPAIGPGELRGGPGAYVVAPCSQVAHTRYKFVSGSPEALAALHPILWRDLSVFLAPGTALGGALRPMETPPIRLVHRDMPPAALALFGELAGAVKGWPVGKYASRSEGEAAIVAMLILAGWSYAEIRYAFECYRPASYAELAMGGRAQYLKFTYRHVLAALASTPEREALALLWEDANTQPWPGRGGGNDRAVYGGVLAIAWQYSAYEANCSQRDLAEHAAVSRRGAQNALKRLSDKKREGGRLIVKAQQNTDTQATTWRIADNPTSCTISSQKSCSYGPVATPELWAVGRLGKSAMLIFTLLHCNDDGGSDVGAQIKKFAIATGKHRNTVSAALRRLESVNLAAKIGGRWVLGPAKLADVALQLDADKAAHRRRAQHLEDRERWHEAIERRRGDD